MPESGTRLRALALAAVLLGLASACAPAPSPGPTRHAILMCMDTVRYDAWELVRRYAPPPADSPWSRAIHLRRAQSTAPWTLPAVASVFTGRYPNAHGAGVFPGEIANFRRQSPPVLDAEAVTLAERLRAAGFATTSIPASRMFQWAGFRQGFERQQFVGGSDSRLKIAAGASARLDRLAREQPERRFFLYLHFMEAHMSPTRLGPEGRAARLARVPAALEVAAREAAPADACAQAGPRCETWLQYVAAVLVIRDTITDLLVGLDARGLLAQTSLALFSDHGEEFLDHLELSRSRGLDPNDRYGGGHGHTLFQEQLHVPVVFWHPDLPGREVDAPASLADLAPTLLDWLGVEAPPGDGVSLGPVLGGADFDAQRPLYSSAVAYGPRRAAVLRGDRKRLSGGGHAPDLSFELDRDPGEQRPSTSGGEDLAALLAEYAAQRPEPRAPAPVDPETLRELHALGYLEELETSADAPAPESQRP